MTKKYLFSFFTAAFLLFAGMGPKSSGAVPAKSASQILFTEIGAGFISNMPSKEVFAIAHQGFAALKAIPGGVKKEILTVIDFSLPSNKKRLWIIDLANKEVLFNDFVAHGRNSGEHVAGTFQTLPAHI